MQSVVTLQRVNYISAFQNRESADAFLRAKSYGVSLQVYPPPKQKDEVASEALELAMGENSPLLQNLANNDYQAAANAIYSTMSILNVGIDYVRISCVSVCTCA